MSDTRLIYVYDPMCSWCYAFNSSLQELQKDLPSTIRFSYLLGGLAPDSTEPMSVDLQNTIQQAWQRIEKTVPNIQFNYDFWLLNTAVRSTYPACRAILAARKQGAKFEIKLLHAIQTAYYQKAKNPSLQETLQACATEVGLNTDMFLRDFNNSAINNELLKEIEFVRNMGVVSYPSLRLLCDDKQFPIAVDYLNHRTMIDEISSFLSSSSKSTKKHI